MRTKFLLILCLWLCGCHNSIYMRMKRGEITRAQARAEMAPAIMVANANFQRQMAENRRQLAEVNAQVGKPYQMTRVDYRSHRQTETVRLHPSGFGGARGMDSQGNTWKMQTDGFGTTTIRKN